MRLFSAFVLLVATVSADAGLRGRRSGFDSPAWFMPQAPMTQWYVPPSVAAVQAAPVPVVQPAPIPTGAQPAAVQPSVATAYGSDDALDEVNARRAARGLPAFVKDPGLTQAAAACAKVRAANFVDGHLGGAMSDFSYLPAGVTASAAGCGALEPSWGWGTCCMDEPYTFAGAAWVMGANGKRYMHLFVR